MLTVQYNLPEGPKFSTSPSTHPDMQRALLTTLAKKNKVPIDPPNSGPNVLLIITEATCQEAIYFCLMRLFMISADLHNMLMKL